MSVTPGRSYQQSGEAAAEQYEFINFSHVNARILLIDDEQIPGKQETMTLTSPTDLVDGCRSESVRDVPHMLVHPLIHGYHLADFW